MSTAEGPARDRHPLPNPEINRCAGSTPRGLSLRTRASDSRRSELTDTSERASRAPTTWIARGCASETRTRSRRVVQGALRTAERKLRLDRPAVQSGSSPVPAQVARPRWRRHDCWWASRLGRPTRADRSSRQIAPQHRVLRLVDRSPCSARLVALSGRSEGDRAMHGQGVARRPRGHLGQSAHGHSSISRYQAVRQRSPSGDPKPPCA